MQALSVDQLVGQNVGNYYVARLLGRGRLSAVYLAQHRSQSTSVALTTYLLPERLAADARQRFMQRFLKESAVLATLDHPHILPVYEYGDQFGYPYLVTPYMMNGSLADVLKRQGRCSPEYVLDVLQQVVSGLDYAQSKGVVHGTLKPSNILLSQEGTMLVAGFGLQHMLQVRGIERNEQPNAHLLSIADTFLCPPEYIAPEVAQGNPIDRRSDIYALGIILFELLSGKPPFTGSAPMETAMMHVNQAIPSLHALCPDIPIALESVVNHALARIPTQRFQRAEELAEAFAQVCQGTLHRTRREVGRDVSSLMEETKASDGNFLLDQGGSSGNNEEGPATGSWQLMPPVITGKTFALRDSHKYQAQSASDKKPGTTGSWQLLPPIVTGQLPTVQPVPELLRKTNAPAQEPSYMTEAVTQPGILPDDLVPPPTRQPQKQSTRPPVENIPLVRSVASAPSAPPSIPNMPTIPPAVPAPVSMPAQPRGFADPQQGQQWWSRSEAEMSNGAVPQMSRPQVQPGMLYSSPTSNRIRRASPRRTNRRAVVAAIVGGGVVAASAGIAIKFNLLHLLANGNTATAHNGPGGQSAQRPPNGQTQGAGGTQSPKTTPTAATQKPTQQPTKAPPAHTGTVVGSTTLASNTSRVFTNPQDGKGSLLIHLPKGSFAAYESACTHEGVTVNYDPNTMTLVCPAHGAIFDPTSGQVLQGPATRALTAVAIKVNTDGTITVG